MHFDKQNDLLSQIIISDTVEQSSESLTRQLYGKRVATFYQEDFLVEHVKDIVKEAYIAESTLKYIIIASQSFNNIVQNSLLKLLEEPPRNIRFILIVPSKSILLPTVLSRLPLYREPSTAQDEITIPISFKNLDLKMILDFIKTNERISKREAKAYVEVMFVKASRELESLNKEQIHTFEQALPLLDLNARPATIFTALLLPFLPKSVL